MLLAVLSHFVPYLYAAWVRERRWTRKREMDLARETW
jgi:hypothetical protein